MIPETEEGQIALIESASKDQLYELEIDAGADVGVMALHRLATRYLRERNLRFGFKVAKLCVQKAEAAEVGTPLLGMALAVFALAYRLRGKREAAVRVHRHAHNVLWPYITAGHGGASIWLSLHEPHLPFGIVTEAELQFAIDTAHAEDPTAVGAWAARVEVPIA